MVTKENYYKIVDEYGLKNLPKDLQEMHDLINQLTQSGSDWSVYDSDQEIRKYAKVQFDQLNKLVSGSANKNYTLEEMKAVLKKYKFDPHHPLMVADKDSGQFQSAYKEFLEEIEKYGNEKKGYWKLMELTVPSKAEKSENRKKVRIQPKSQNSKLYIVWDMETDQKFANENFKNVADAKAFVKENKMELVDVVLVENKTNANTRARKPRQRKPKFSIGDKIYWAGENGIVETIQDITHDSNGYPVYNADYNGAQTKYDESTITEYIRDKRIAINKKPPHQKRVIPKEITYIKRYLRYDGQVVEFDNMRRFLKSMQLSITKGEIEKTSKYADILMEIQENLVRGVNAMLKEGLTEIKVEIAKNKVQLLKDVSGAVIVGKSTRLIKRFLTWLNNMETDKAKKLKTEIDKHLKNQAVDYIEELQSIQKALTQFLNKKEISMSEMELHGLAGIAGMDGLGFLPQMLATASGIVVGNQVNQYLKRSKAENAAKPTIMSSTDISKSDFETLKFTGDWKTLIGEPSPGFSCLMFGPPKSGKSTLAIAFAKYLAQNFGKTLYVAAEEGIHATLSDKIKRLDAVHPELHFASSMPSTLSNYKFVFIDSINRSKLAHPDLIDLINKNPGISFIFISQVTKDGKYRGSQEIEHDVDCIIEVDQNGIAFGKGRFAQGGEVEIGFG